MSLESRMDGGFVNRNGMVEGRGYEATGISISNSGSIMDGYRDTGCRVDGGGNVLGSYGMPTGLIVSNFGTINRDGRG